MTIGPRLTDMVFPPVPGTEGQPAGVFTIPASGVGLTYTAPFRLTLVIRGTLTSINYIRGATSVTLPLLTGSTVEMNTGDRLTMVYVVPPTITAIPR